MERFYKTISVILHPIVVPTICILIYFMLVATSFDKDQKLGLLGLIFVSTYIIPLIILILFKKLKLIKTFNAESIKERKLPIAMMIVLFYLLGNNFFKIEEMEVIGLIFYATSLGLTFIYFFSAFNLKVSIHLLSLGISTSFFIVLGFIESQNFSIFVIVNILLAGILGNARVHLKAHSQREVYLGFIFGILSPLIIYFFL